MAFCECRRAHATAGSCHRYLPRRRFDMPTITRTESSTLVVNTAVDRKTEKPPRGPSFGALMGSAADLALSGVEVGATVVGGPIVGAAVRGVRQAAASPAGPLSSTPGAASGE